MFSDSTFREKLIATDIIVWNGVIGRYGNVQKFICDGDFLRMANDEEVDFYKQGQNWHNMKISKEKALSRAFELLEKTAEKPTHFQILRAVESVAIKYIPKEWISDHHLDSFVIEFYTPDGRQVGINWLGTEFFELPIHEKLPIQTLIDLK